MSESIVKFTDEQLKPIINRIVDGGNHMADLLRLHNNSNINSKSIMEWYWDGIIDSPNSEEVIMEILNFCHKNDYVELHLFRALQGCNNTESYKFNFSANEYTLIDHFNENEQKILLYEV